MTMQSLQWGLTFPGAFLAHPRIAWGGTFGGLSFATLGTIDAAGEKIAFMGQVKWDGAPASAKTFGTSSKIHFRTNTVTFADAATTLRIGIQDLSGAGSGVTSMTPDGTFDVYVDLAGNGGVLTSSDDNVVKSVTMSTGSKSIAHGDMIAVVFDLTARGGADSVGFGGIVGDGYGVWPAFRVYTTSWQNFSGLAVPNILLEADDGTIGILRGAPFVVGNGTTSMSNVYQYTSASASDEYGLIFQVPFRCKIDGALVSMGANATNADATLTLYSAPLGTPASMVSTTILGEQSVGATDDRPRFIHFGSEVQLEPNTDYCLALAATDAGTIDLGYVTFGSATYRAVHGMANCRRGARADGSGAFSETTTEVPLMAVNITALDDGNGGGRTSMNIGGLC